ncbi:hypothetical protein D3C80_755340 [compost metagenome]
MHLAHRAGVWGLVHQAVEVIDQAAQAVDATGGLVGGITGAESRLGHKRALVQSAILARYRDK